MRRFGRLELILIGLLVLFILFKFISLIIGISFGILGLAFRYWYVTIPVILIFFYFSRKNKMISQPGNKPESKDEIIVELKKDDE